MGSCAPMVRIGLVAIAVVMAVAVAVAVDLAKPVRAKKGAKMPSLIAAAARRRGGSPSSLP